MTLTSHPQHDFKQLSSKLDALTIILTRPCWPHRHDLTKVEAELYDAITNHTKPYTLAIASDDFATALDIAAKQWMRQANAAMSDAKRAWHPARKKLLDVWRHYMNAVADWSKLQ